MKRQLSIFLLIVLFGLTFSTQANQDSLWSVWNDNAQPDTLRLQAISSFAWDGYLFTQPDSAYYYAQLQYDFAEKADLYEFKANALNIQGISLSVRGKNDQALEYFKRVIKIYEGADDKSGLSKSHNNIANVYYRQGEHDQALHHYKIGLALSEVLNDKENIARVLRNITKIYHDKGDYSQAFDYLTTSLKINEDLDNQVGVAQAYLQIAIIYKDLGEIEKSLDYNNKSLVIMKELDNRKGIANAVNNMGACYDLMGDYDKALEYYQESLIIEKEIQDKRGEGHTLTNIGAIYSKSRKFEEALINLNQSKKIQLEIGDKKGLTQTINKIAIIHFERGEYKKAIIESNNALALAQQNDFITVIRDAAHNLYLSYKARGMTAKALEMHELSNTMQDSVASEENQREVIRQEYKYNYEKMALADSISFANERLIKEAQSKRKRTILYALIAGLIMLFIFLFIIYNRLIVTRRQRKIIDEKIKTEKTLIESEKKFADVFNSMEDVFTRSDLDGNCILISPSVFNVLGYKPEEILGEKLSDFYADPDQRNSLVEKLQKSIKVESFEIEIVKKDGGIITASTNAKIYFDDDGNPLGIEGLIRDITDIKLAEIEITESEKRFRATFEQAAVGIAHVSPDGRFLRTNEKFCEILGYGQDEILTSNFQKITHPEDLEKDLAHVQNLLNGGAKTYFTEKRYIRKDEIIIWASLTLSLLQRENSEPDYFVAVVEDITDKKNAELKIFQHQQRLKDLALDFAISEEKVRKQIAIDLHDDVSQLLSSSRMQLAKVLNLEENPEITVRIKYISKSLLKSIQSTREAIFNLSPPHLSEMGLYAAVHDWVYELIETKYDINTSITGEHEVFDMEDTTRFLIFRSIKELVMNVIKHAGAKQLKVDFKRKGEILEITVLDDGVGFKYNAELLKQKSNSYGLFSVEERLSDLGGSLTIDSVINKGTKATLSLPLKGEGAFLT